MRHSLLKLLKFGCANLDFHDLYFQNHTWYGHRSSSPNFMENCAEMRSPERFKDFVSFFYYIVDLYGEKSFFLRQFNYRPKC